MLYGIPSMPYTFLPEFSDRDENLLLDLEVVVEFVVIGVSLRDTCRNI